MIYLLVGPKGSGKSFIGSLMNEHFGIHFVRVEEWAKKVKRDRDPQDEQYVKEVFHFIELGIREEIKKHDLIAFESTGLTTYFDQMLTQLQKDFLVVIIQVSANLSLCLNRVKSRDQTIHINISDDQVNNINLQAVEKQLPSEYTIQNENKTVNELLKELRSILF